MRATFMSANLVGSASGSALARAQLDGHGMRVSSLAGSFGTQPAELDACCRLAITLRLALR